MRLPAFVQHRKSLALPLLPLLMLAGTPPEAFAQMPPEPASVEQVPASAPVAPHYWLRVSGDRVNLRSRPDANSRIVGRVERDDVLEAVGSVYGWERIVPPEGVFSLVSARYIERLDSGRGVVRVDTTLRVRVGSDVQARDPLLSEVQARLPRDAEVQIVGELAGGWLKIVPPAGVCVYVSGDYVERISAEVAQRLRAARGGARPTSRSARSQRAATTRPVEPPELTGRWGARLKPLLATIESEGRKPLREQSWEAVLSALRPVTAQRDEPQVARLAGAWMEKIEQRVRDQARWRQAREIAEQAERERARHVEELEEIQRARESVTTQPGFDARGVLRPSFSLQPGPYGLRYSLQDPFTHEVRAYVEFPPELGVDVQACVGKYVGVRGRRQSVAGLRVPLLRVGHITVLNPDGSTSQPARGNP